RRPARQRWQRIARHRRRKRFARAEIQRRRLARRGRRKSRAPLTINPGSSAAQISGAHKQKAPPSRHRGAFFFLTSQESKSQLVFQPAAIEVLHQQHFISILIVNQLIHQFLREQYPVPARPHPSLLPERRVTNRIALRVRHRRMLYFVQRKSFAGILDAAQHHIPCAHVGNLHVLVRPEFRAMLDRVQQNLAKRDRHRITLSLRQIPRTPPPPAFPPASGKSTISRRNWISRSAVCRSLRTISRIHSGVADTTSIPSSQQGASVARCTISASASSENGFEK